LNDPFGGWVYWTRVPVGEIERIEVSEGSSAGIFGDRAMGGVISLFSREPEPHFLDARFETAAWGTADAFAGYSMLRPRWGLSGGGRAFRTDGYYIVPADLRGSVDRRAGVNFVTGYSHFDLFGGANRLSLGLDLLAEERRNGTALQTNATSLGTASVHYERPSISVLAWHSREVLRSVFSAVAADRSSERITFRQTAPAQATGGGALWQRQFSRAGIKFGADSVRYEGYSTDRLLPSGVRTGGGTLWTRGAFGQGELISGPARFFTALRGDSPGRGAGFLNPSAGAALMFGPVRGWFSFYRGFRAPTLNELYREFRVGNTVTLANDALGAERMQSFETGIAALLERTHLSFALYHNSLEGFITNVTVSASPQLIVRQRRNARAGLARGIEADARRQWGPVTAHLGYLFADSRFTTGVRIPQVPRHQGSGDVAWEHGGTFAAAGFRALSAQFDYDMNSFLRPGYCTVFVTVRRRIAGSLSAVAGIENLLNREYLVALTPYPNTGARRLWRVGMRWRGQLW
jgi:outer membrane receptor protein involved in Fe transport